MLRSVWVGLALVVCWVVPAFGQADAPSLEGYFTGKEVLVKIDMPGSQKGVDLKFNKPSPMDWNDYSSRIKTYGIAIRKGDVVRVTKFVVKNDMIEFQLAGGGFGTAGDDSNTTVTAAYGYVTQDVQWKRWVLFLSAMPLAVLGNMARVTSVALVAQVFGQEVASKYRLRGI